MEDYIRLAALQGCIPQDFAAFRRFLALQALRLLRQQNQIARLRLALGRHATAGRQGTEPGTVLSGLALDPSQDLSENEKKQLQLWDELDAKLAVYAEGLIRFDALCRLSPVDPDHRQMLMDWMTDPVGGKDGFHDVEGEFWNEEYLGDLAALGASKKPADLLTAIVIGGVIRTYHHIFGHKIRDKVSVLDPFTGGQQTTAAFLYADKHIGFVVNAINTVAASSIISLSALVLYFIPSVRARLGAIVAFTVSFSVVLVLMTGASRTECFVATAAYAAVLVVFVGADGTNSSA